MYWYDMSEQNTFSVIKAKREGKSAIIVVDTALHKGAKPADFPWLLTITLPISHPDLQGLCDQAESDRLSDIEDQLLDQLDPYIYKYLGRSTWNLQRDVFIYVSDPDLIIETLQQQLSYIDLNDINISINQQHEPNWETYRQFVSTVEGI